jgi:dTDP-glucose 4,6-dehydratase
MKLLVTGGAGFIGSNFIRYWLKNHAGDSIVNLDILTYAGNLESLQDLESNPNYKFVKGDICDAALVNSLVKDVDLIVHFAAESHVDRSIKNSADFIRTNVEGTRVLLEAARIENQSASRRSSIRFHHVSTDEVFGALDFGAPKFNEKTPYDPRSPYSASKAASDHLVRAYYHTYKLPVTISNCSNNYGPYQYPEKLIPLFITNLLEGKKVPVYGAGANVRDWIHVDDHNRGVDLIISKGRSGETYCLGGGNEKTNLEITKIILSLLGKGEEMVEYVADRLGHDLRYAIDFSKAKQELGWEPLKSFAEGLAATVDWYKNNEAWWKKLK